MIIEKCKVPYRNGYVAGNILKCDECYTIFKERHESTKKKAKKRSDHLCSKCLDKLCSKLSSDRLKVTIKKRTPDEHYQICSRGGKTSQANGGCAKGWFSAERWNAMSEDEQIKQVTRANTAMQEKINNMSPEEKAAHFCNVMKGRLGYTSKGQKEVFDNLSSLDFELNYQISNMNVDVCHPVKKIVIEYNGDAFHCNPKFWEPDQYSTLIRMTAGEKWAKDIARYAVLKKLGYRVIVIWESDWKINKINIMKNIKDIYASH